MTSLPHLFKSFVWCHVWSLSTLVMSCLKSWPRHNVRLVPVLNSELLSHYHYSLLTPVTLLSTRDDAVPSSVIPPAGPPSSHSWPGQSKGSWKAHADCLPAVNTDTDLLCRLYWICVYRAATFRNIYQYCLSSQCVANASEEWLEEKRTHVICLEAIHTFHYTHTSTPVFLRILSVADSCCCCCCH